MLKKAEDGPTQISKIDICFSSIEGIIEALDTDEKNNLLERIRVKYLLDKLPKNAFVVGENYNFWEDDNEYDEDIVSDKKYVINLCWDQEAYVWVAIGDEIGLVLESDSIEILMDRVKLAVPELLSLNKLTIHKPITLSFIIKCEL